MSNLWGYLKTFLRDLVSFFIIYMPGSTGRRIRYFYYRRRFKKCGKNVLIDEGVVIENPEWMSIGNNTWIGSRCVLKAGPLDLGSRIVKRKEKRNFRWQEGELVLSDNVEIAPSCQIQAHGGIYIGSNCGISSGAKLYSVMNLPTNPYDRRDVIFFSHWNTKSAYMVSPIIFEENVGIGLNSVVLAGVHIGKNSFVAANSVVMGSFGENSFIKGNRAKRIKDRFKIKKEDE